MNSLEAVWREPNRHLDLSALPRLVSFQDSHPIATRTFRASGAHENPISSRSNHPVWTVTASILNADIKNTAGTNAKMATVPANIRNHKVHVPRSTLQDLVFPGWFRT